MVRHHLVRTSEWCEEFSEKFSCLNTGLWMGLLHDFGKYSIAFLEVLQHKRCHIDHAMPGTREKWQLSLPWLFSSMSAPSVIPTSPSGLCAGPSPVWSGQSGGKGRYLLRPGLQRLYRKDRFAASSLWCGNWLPAWRYGRNHLKQTARRRGLADLWIRKTFFPFLSWAMWILSAWGSPSDESAALSKDLQQDQPIILWERLREYLP